MSSPQDRCAGVAVAHPVLSTPKKG
jgi:hypothetical protein